MKNKFLKAAAAVVLLTVSNISNAQWLLDGNTNVQSTSFLGSKSAQPLSLGTTTAYGINFLTSNTLRMQILPSGHVGIGRVPLGDVTSGTPPYHTTTPSPILQIQGYANGYAYSSTGPRGDIFRINSTENPSKKLGIGFVQSGSTNYGAYIQSSDAMFLDSPYIRITGITTIGDALSPTSPFLTIPNAQYKLYVLGGILTEKIKCGVNGTGNWSDFVFKKDYKLRSLSEVEKFINKNGHLPEIPSAEEVVKNGIDVAEMDAKLLQKIEELTLYMIEMKKEVEALKQENKSLKSSK